MLVAMSGGVDSSVAAVLLAEQGYEVVGVTLKLFGATDGSSDTPVGAADPIRSAASVAKRLDIPHHVLDVSDTFRSEVVEHFAAEYEMGRTPIPCVRCNSLIKFKELLKYADDLGCRFLATGHYAIMRNGALYRGRDRDKEQTYFLWRIDRSVLVRLLLPLGEYEKDETRSIARKHGLGNAQRPESVEICFANDDDYIAVLYHYLELGSQALAPGPIVTTTGREVGEHSGYARYTVGQRRRLPGGFPEPMYVVRIIPEERTVVIGTEGDLWGKTVVVGEFNWLTTPLEVGDSCRVSTRYRSKIIDAVVTVSETSRDDRFLLRLAEPVRAITPGQSCVMYDFDDRLLGGGVIQ